MRRLLRIRLVLVLVALVLAPATVLPFAERLRTEWTNFWEPEPEEPDWVVLISNLEDRGDAIYLCPSDLTVYAAGNAQEVDPPRPADVVLVDDNS